MPAFDFDVDHLDLDKIAESGQVFRWRKEPDDTWVVPAGGKVAKLSQFGSALTIECADGDIGFWKTYLSVDEDYDAVIKRLSGVSSYQDAALEYADGIRILRQPFFETAVSFLCSQNNSIRNISKSIGILCGGTNEPFPSPAQVVERLQSDTCKLGYRVPYISLFARSYMAGRFDDIEKLAPIAKSSSASGNRPEYDDVSRRLMAEKGIGPKVAACIALFSLGYDEAVPRDVWIKRLEDEYDVSWDPDLAGIQQQFLFHAIRNGVI